MSTRDTVYPRPLQDGVPATAGARICFGCGADNPHGLRIKSYVDGERCLCRFIPDPHHTAFPGVLNGGIVASLMDCHGIWTAVADFERRAGRDPHREDIRAMFVTRNLSVEFLKPAPMGRELKVVGEVTGRGTRSVTVSLALRDGDTLLATGSVVAVRVEG